MKANLLKLCMAGIMLIALHTGCNKKEPANPDQGKVIQLTINGSSTEQLEFIYKDSVIAVTTNPAQIVINTLLSVGDQDAKLEIRKKGTTAILERKQISNAPYAQNISIYYDGNKVYDTAVTLIIKGYALSGELEFLIDGQTILSGTGAINNSNNAAMLLMDKGTTKEVQIRKKGETAALLTKTIESSPARQSLNFFFDGKNLVDNLELDPPVNPDNMMIKAKFETQYAANFKGVDVDVVFYTKDPRTNAAAVKVSPEIRFTLFKDGTFNSIELPPLPANYIYTYDIFEKGTDQIPYINVGPPITANGFPLTPNLGRFGELKFDAGKSKLLVLRDNRNLIGTPRGTALSGAFTDLSQYFQ